MFKVHFPCSQSLPCFSKGWWQCSQRGNLGKFCSSMSSFGFLVIFHHVDVISWFRGIFHHVERYHNKGSVNPRESECNIGEEVVDRV